MILSRLLLSVLLLASPLSELAFAQTTESPATETPAANPRDTALDLPPGSSNVVEPIAPYDDKLLRLSEVLGSIHYLRALCGAKEDGKWRDYMSKLIGAEEPGPRRRARLVARFNRGFRAFDGTYGSCTQSALFAADNYVKEGALLSSQITGRYGR